MSGVVARRLWTAAVAEFLADSTPYKAGRAQAPINTDPPYYVVYVIPGGGFPNASLQGAYQDASMVYQVNAVGKRDDQAELLQDAARDAMLLRAVEELQVPAGWALMEVSPDGGPGGVEYSGNPPHRLFTSSERYVLHATPAAS